ncbi:MAG: excinuclease ABC subunit UvrC [Nitrospinota bacterium]
MSAEEPRHLPSGAGDGGASAVEAPGRVSAEFLRSLPDAPGIYLFRDSAGAALYVGKAKNLRNRVRGYFARSHGRGPWISRMVEQVASVDYVVTDREVEALILESNYIKRHKPKYNVVLKDDKQFPYLKFSTQEQAPRLSIVRRVGQEGATYLGPYPSAASVRQTIRFIQRTFHIRACTGGIEDKTSARCLYFQMGQCQGPCDGHQSPEDYGRAVGDALDFLRGRDRELSARLKAQMAEASDALAFERAAKLRDQIRAIERVTERQEMVSLGGEDQDVVGLSRVGHVAFARVFFVRGGKLLGDKGFRLNYRAEEPSAELLGAFVKQFYAAHDYVPPEVLLPGPIPDREVVEAWLGERRGKRVRLLVPERGHRRRLVGMANQNAGLALQRREEQLRAEDATLADLQRWLELEVPPERVEAFDISCLMGTQAVGASVLFVGGRPAKEGYRRYKVRGPAGPDDCAMLAEVLSRRYTRLINEGGELPDLILIDGGKGQLSAALAVLEELGVGDIACAALAKGRSAENPEDQDVVFLPGRSEPVRLPEGPAKHLLQRVRDEVHRFALTFHRSFRSRTALRSRLEEVPGLGPRRRRALLRHFGSLRRVVEAPLEQLLEVQGMTERVARALKEHFSR